MAAPEGKDPRFRPYRAASWGVYLVLTVTFSLAITFNVVRSTLAMTPPRPASSGQLETIPECVTRARALWAELDGRRKALSEEPSANDADAQWTKFRLDWLVRERDASSRCVAEVPERGVLKKIFHRLEALNDLYTVHAVQFAGEIGPTIDKLRAELDAASKAP